MHQAVFYPLSFKTALGRRPFMASTYASKASATREEEYVKAVVMKVCEKGVYAEKSSYIQAVQELAESLAPLFDANPRYFYIFKSMVQCSTHMPLSFCPLPSSDLT